MRKLNRKAADSSLPGLAPAPTPPPAPVPAPVAPATTTAIAHPPRPVGALPAFVRPANMTPSSLPGVPWIGFYEQRMEGNRPAQIVAQLGPQQTGAPFLCVGEKYYSMAGLAVVAIDSFFYWCTLTPGVWTPDKVWLENPGRAADIKEQGKAILLVVPGTAELPEGLRDLGAVTTLTNFRGPKVPALKEIVEGIEATQTPEWVRANAPLAQVEPQFRVCATFVTSAETAQSGFGYVRANARVQPVGAAQIAALSKWRLTQGAALEEVAGFMDRACEELEKQAERTTGAQVGAAK